MLCAGDRDEQDNEVFLVKKTGGKQKTGKHCVKSARSPRSDSGQRQGWIQLSHPGREDS